ncbi:MAG: arginine repressor [Candidatus Babeliales bacterium]
MKQEIKLTERQKAIKELIQTYEITDQHKLIELLRLKYGIDTNQTIVSRELHKLGVTKTPIENKLIYELPEEKTDPAKEILRLAITKVVHNETLIVVHTLAGLADFVGDYLDAHGTTINILGTLAGENVVFVTPNSIKEIAKVYDQVCKLLLIKQIKD